ncbi:hypothetical protein [Moheibacter sp.]|uniref:hypothetical protein n=1 Tax=Moheibacter sp. TaxID=1965316 RepID=UPI003C72828C
MNFKFQIKKEDYQKSLRGYFLYLLPPVLLISFFFSLIIAYSFASPKPDADFNLSVFIIALVISFGLLIFFFWGIKYLKSIRRLKRTETESADTVLNVEVLEKGILLQKINSDKKIQKTWTEIKNLIHRKEFTYLIFTDGTYLFIKNNSITNENKEFIPIIKEKIKPFRSEMGRTLIWYSFIPLIGFIFGIVFFARGIFDRHLKNFLIGILSFIFSGITFWCFLFFMDNTGKNTGSDTYRNKNNLNQIVKELAYYKLKNGKFPDTLDSLKIQTNFIILVEIETSLNPFSDLEIREIYYENRDSTFILRTLGPDGKPFTEDDILPDY